MKRNRNKSKPAPPAPKSDDASPARPSKTPELSLARKWIFSLVAFVILPIALLGALELGLRIGGYGYPTNFFKHIKKINEDFLVENDKFGLRFFPPALARSPAPVIMRATKPEGTYRIFLLGESAALGDPRPAYGAGRYLQALLQERFPGTHFEVICVAMTAINSHAILPIARECARQEGDLWIVYMGNNEMVGPFGATKVFGSKSPAAWQVRLVVAAQRLRIGQLVMALGRKVMGTSKASSWGGMQMFMENRVAPDEPRKEVIYQNFRQNLRDILQAGLRSGARVILNTVACNLRDCPPFASMPADTLNASDQTACDKLRESGAAAEKEGQFASAAQYYQDAARLDARSADLEFRQGDCLLRATNNLAALSHFEKARDLDGLPFRADSRVNKVIRDAATEMTGNSFGLCDAAGIFATNNPYGIPGDESFYEHVHFNFDGNYRLARAWAEQVEQLMPAGAASPTSVEWASQEICERRLGLTDWNRASVLEDMLRRFSQPPFTNQMNQITRLGTTRRELHELRQRLTKEGAAQARVIYEEALRNDPSDHRLHENFAEFLEAVGDLSKATDEWQAVRGLIPQHHLAYFQAGRLLGLQGRAPEAETLLLGALELRPDLSEGWLELGKCYASEGKHELAIKEYEQARKLVPQDYRVFLRIGSALSRLNRRTEAIQQFRQAIQLRPDYWEAVYALGEELAFDKKVSEAREQFEKVIRLKPDYAMAHLNLGVALVQQGELDVALKEFESTLRLDPNNNLASNYLYQVRARKEGKL